MNSGVARGLMRGVIVAGVMAGLTLPARAQTNAGATTSELAAQEKEACCQNLKVIYAAIQAYEADHKDLPNWLSDLVPQYLPDANVLICPISRRTGKTESPPLADPNISTSYLFEFCPVNIPTGNRNAPVRTRREWKRRQMGLVGSGVPIVRCRLHNPVLNLAFDGRIYESTNFWEYLFTNRVSFAELTAPRLFADDAPASPRPAPSFPARDARARPGLIDLTRYYNAALTESWLGKTNGDLALLPEGLQTFAGVEFDVRGIVQAGSRALTEKRYPPQIKGIAVHQKCRRLHFLHAAGFGKASDEGTQVASYLVHFAGNQARLEIPIVYGREISDWRAPPEQAATPPELTVAWTANNAPPNGAGGSLRLFETTWTNLAPEAEVESIDFISSMGAPAPFLIAITAD